jgi:hypothetical protein
LNALWGVALAPADFGRFSCALLIGNVNDGRINAFDPESHGFLGPLTDQSGEPIAILGLWSLVFGGDGPYNGQTNQLFFAAGPGPNFPTIYTEGLFGMIQAAQGCETTASKPHSVSTGTSRNKGSPSFRDSPARHPLTPAASSAKV